MTSESPYNYKLDIRAVASTLLQLSPIVLIIIYILEYTYIFQFLSQFNVTPEEVGISEIKLLTRAATLTLTVISIFGLLFAIAASLVAAIQTSVEESGKIQGILRSFKLTKKPSERNRGSIAQSIRVASQQADSVRNGSVVSYALAFVLIIQSLKPLGIQLNILVKIALFAVGIILSATLFTAWRNKKTRYLTFACGITIAVCLLGIAVIDGGINTGTKTIKTGYVPLFINLLGVDIAQVHPEWLNSQVAPPQYSQDQDLLELGSDVETTFLYDCGTDTTYRIPLDNVVLTYPLYLGEASSTILQRLHCA
jgi:hypothetical protein